MSAEGDGDDRRTDLPATGEVRRVGFIHTFTGPAAERHAHDEFQNHREKPHGIQPARIIDTTTIGDQAAYQTAVQRDGTATVALIVRKTTTVVEVTYE